MIEANLLAKGRASLALTANSMVSACCESQKSIYFWMAICIFTFVEPILCGFYPSHDLLIAQQLILAINSVLFLIHAVAVVTDESKSKQRSSKLMVIRGLFQHSCFALECVCLATGWIFIFFRPGIACFRCFRVFRILW
jgi:hypothetical protein